MEKLRKAQTAKSSMVESATNMAIGSLMNIGITQLIGPLLGITVTWTSNIELTIIFIITSTIRSYFIRRGFEKWLRK